jgi:hypothetical protein
MKNNGFKLLENIIYITENTKLLPTLKIRRYIYNENK